MTQPNEEKNAPDTITHKDPLVAITSRLRLYYDQWKQGEKDKDKARKEFFAEVSKRSQCDERLVEITADSQAAAQELLTERYPLWTIQDIRPVRPGPEDLWEAIIIENPEYKKFTYFNPENKMIYERQISQGAIMLDDERLLADNPELYRRVTEVPYEQFIKTCMYESGAERQEIDERFERLMEAYPEVAPPRTLKDLKTLPDEDLAALQPYIYEGKATARLAKPRKATEEELSELE